MPDLDLDRLKDVPRPKLRSRAEVDAEHVRTADALFDGTIDETEFRERWLKLLSESFAPDPAPAPSEREQELQREVEELKRDRVAIDKHSAGLIEELERVRSRNRFLESIISQVAAEAQRPQP